MTDATERAAATDRDAYIERLVEVIWPTAWGEWPGDDGVYEVAERVAALVHAQPTEPTRRPECDRPDCAQCVDVPDPDSSDVERIVSPAWMSALLREHGILTESPGVRAQIAGRMAARVAAVLRGEKRQDRTVSGTGLARRAAARAVVAAHDEAGLPVNQATRDLAEGS